jgi:DNA-binding transcriptional ArsR family regulator
MVVVLAHPNRLPILVALEERPRTVQELVDDLGLRPDPVKHALKQLRSAELVDVVETRGTTNNLVGFVYGTTLTGWSTVVDALAAVAATR